MNRGPFPDDSVIGGYIADRRGLRPGYAVLEGGEVTEIRSGDAPDCIDFPAVVMVDPVNGHTHCGDYGLDVGPGMTLEELVAPPDGLKHRYLRETPAEKLSADIRSFGSDSRSFGIGTFADFREGGAEGCRILREQVPDAVILGRPVSPEFDPGEVEDILSVADGIGISSISDMPRGYIEDVADMVREERGIFAIHVSERVREDIDFVLSLDPAFVVHMCEADDTDLLKCAEAEVPVVVCPRSNRYFGKEPPLARMAMLGVDVAIGTDNGMLCSPDLVPEMACFADIMESQGGDPSEVWSAPFVLQGKLLNRSKQIKSPSSPGCVAAIQLENGDPLGSLRGPETRGHGYAYAGQRRNRNGFSEHTRADRRKRIYEGSCQEGRRAG